MDDSEKKPRELISEQAADWFVANRAGLTEQQCTDFAAWLQASPMHVEEYLHLATLSHDLREACDQPDNSIEQIVARARAGDRVVPLRPYARTDIDKKGPSWWPRAAVALAALAALDVGLYATRGHWLSRSHVASETTTVHFVTRHGQQQTIVLADGSILHLNTDTAATVQYGPSERNVILTAGEAHLRVAHVVGRPFHVIAGATDIVDLGTEFDVRLQERATLVTVVEGRVAVKSRTDQHDAGRALELEANHQIEVQANGVQGPPILVDTARTTAWLHRQIIFEREALDSVAQEFSRYSVKPIEIVSPSLRSLPISGVFSVEDTDTFVTFLRSLEGVRVEVTPTQINVRQH